MKAVAQVCCKWQALTFDENGQRIIIRKRKDGKPIILPTGVGSINDIKKYIPMFFACLVHSSLLPPTLAS